jgi:hypothetical protein
LEGTTQFRAASGPVAPSWTKVVTKYIKETFPLCPEVEGQNVELNYPVLEWDNAAALLEETGSQMKLTVFQDKSSILSHRIFLSV